MRRLMALATGLAALAWCFFIAVPPASAFPLTTCTATITSMDASGNVISTATGGGAGGWVRVRPVEVIVREGDGSERRVPIPDAEAAVLRSTIVQALAVCGVCAAVVAGRALVGALRPRQV